MSGLRHWRTRHPVPASLPLLTPQVRRLRLRELDPGYGRRLRFLSYLRLHLTCLVMATTPSVKPEEPWGKDAEDPRVWEKACFKDKWLPAIVYARGEGKTHMGLKEDTPRNGEGRWGGSRGSQWQECLFFFFAWPCVIVAKLPSGRSTGPEPLQGVPRPVATDTPWSTGERTRCRDPDLRAAAPTHGGP